MKASNQPSSSKPSTSNSGTRLPPVVEWLTFTMKQLKTTSTIFIQELEGVLTEWVDKNLDELLKEEYQAARITERVVKEFHQITAKTIVSLNEQDRQTKIELKERFPWVDKIGRGGNDSNEGDKSKLVNGTRTVTEAKEVENTVIVIGNGISASESDEGVSLSDKTDSKSKVKGKKAEETKNAKKNHDRDADADGDQELPDVVSTKKSSRAQSTEHSDREMDLSDDEAVLPDSPPSPVQLDQDESSNPSPPPVKTGKEVNRKEKASDSESDGEDVNLNNSIEAETEDSNDGMEDKLESSSTKNDDDESPKKPQDKNSEEDSEDDDDKKSQLGSDDEHCKKSENLKSDDQDEKQSPEVSDVEDEKQSPEVSDVEDEKQSPEVSDVEDEKQSPEVSDVEDEKQSPEVSDVEDEKLPEETVVEEDDSKDANRNDDSDNETNINSKKRDKKIATQEKSKSEESDEKDELNSDTANVSMDVFSSDEELADTSLPGANSDDDSGNNSEAEATEAVPKKIKSSADGSSLSAEVVEESKPESPTKVRKTRQCVTKAKVLSDDLERDSPSPRKDTLKKTSAITAPFKQPKKLDKSKSGEKNDLKDVDEQGSEDEEDQDKPFKDFKIPKEKPKANSATSDVDLPGGDSSDSESEHARKNDYKLKPGSSYVAVERLPDVIEKRLETHKYVIINQSDSDNDKKRSRGRRKRNQEPDDPLTKALKKLAAFNPYVSEKNKRSQRTTTAKSTRSNKNGSKSTAKDDLIDLARDDQTTEESSDDEPVLKRKIEPIIPGKLKSQDSDIDLVGSDDEELDGRRSSSDEGAARRNVLKNAKVKKELMSDGEEKDKDVKSGEKRKKGASYYTPKVCKIPDQDDSENSDDDDFITKKRKLTKTKKKAVIHSDSDEDDSSGDKKKKSKYVELSSESDDSDSGRNTRSRKKKRRGSSSDSDHQKKKRRKRIVSVSDSDGGSKRKSKKKGKKGSDVEILSGSDSDIQEISEDAGKGRKNIRGIMNKKDLQRDTRRAEEEEEKRKKRLVERQAQFNELFKAPETEVIEQLVLDYDAESKQALVSVDSSIAKKLKPHQAQGITFMFNACIETVEQFKKPNTEGSGCILAHCMGLGKTLQTIAFIHSVMTSELLDIKSVLIMCPLNTVGNWNNELKMWLRESKKRVSVHKLYEEKNVPNRVQALQAWRRRGGVGIIHYDCFRGLVLGKRIKKNHQTVIADCLLDPGPDLVICDEGHVFKNDKSKISVAVNKIRTKRRVVLTGTPLQNNLLEYHCMMQFVKPNLLGSKKEFSNRFVNPIINGQHKDSTSFDVSIMKKRAHVLHKLLDGCVQRLDYSVLMPYLPPKYEYVVLINMTEIQKKLYTHYLNSIKEQTSVQELIKGGLLLKHAANLAKVFCHPYSLVLKHNENNGNASTSSESEGSLADFINDDETTTSDSDVDWLDDNDQVLKKKSNKEDKDVKLESEDSTSNPLPDPDKLSGDIINQGGDWWSKFFKSKADIQCLEHSSKMLILLDIIKTCEGIQDKVLVFSQYLYSLNMIEEFLETLDEEAKRTDIQDSFPAFPKTTDYSPRWRKNIEYFRIDGSTKSADRQKNCDIFNKTDTSRAKLFLISTKAGGLGINLVGANRVVIFDASWNPSQDMQSIFRVFRFGQTKPCYIYRLLAKGTIEEKIYNRQVVKLSLSGRVVDEHQIERHFTFDDIAKMYEYDPDEKTDRPTPPVPKDRLLADLLMTHKDVIDTYLEHDSLLQNQAGEELSEEERKTAWEEYQSEKNNLRMNMNPNMMNNAFHSMMTSANMIEVEQAYDKMKGKIREMYPNLSPEDFNRYTMKVQGDVDQLRSLTYQYHENHLGFTESLRNKWIEVLQQKKRAIQSYFTIPGALQKEMYALGLVKPVEGGPISVVPLSNILEQPTSHLPNPMYASMNQIYFNQRGNMPNAHRPTILNRVRNSIPTTTVPYNPSANQPSTSYSYSGPSAMN